MSFLEKQLIKTEKQFEYRSNLRKRQIVHRMTALNIRKCIRTNYT